MRRGRFALEILKIAHGFVQSEGLSTGPEKACECISTLDIREYYAPARYSNLELCVHE